MKMGKKEAGKELASGINLVLSCEVMEQEIRKIQNGRGDCKLLDYGLHRTPENMTQALQVEIDRASKLKYDHIILGYGLCSNGILGLRVSKQPIVIPRVHDCISLFLGSSKSYQQQMFSHPGTYYLTPGWIEKGETPLSKYENYCRSYDRETALWVLKEEMKSYTRIALIDSGLVGLDPYRSYARKNADFLGIQYEELKGSFSFFERLLTGFWDKRDFVILRKGQRLIQDMFLKS